MEFRRIKFETSVQFESSETETAIATANISIRISFIAEFHQSVQNNTYIASRGNMPFFRDLAGHTWEISAREYIERMKRPCCCAETSSDRKAYGIFLDFKRGTPEYEEDVGMTFTSFFGPTAPQLVLVPYHFRRVC